MKPQTHPLRHLTLTLLMLMMVGLPGLINTAQADTVGPIKSMPPHPVGHNSWVNSVAFSPDGRYALSGSLDATMKLWNVATGEEIRTFTGHTWSVSSVAFSPDGRYALSGSEDKDNTLKLWEVATGAEIRTFTGHTESVYSVAFSPDGRYALSGSSDETLKLWNVATGDEIRTFTGHTESVYSAFSPDGRYVLSGSLDDTLKLWDVATGDEIRTFTGHTNWVRSVAFSPDGRYVLSGSNDKTLKLWDVGTGTEIRTFTGHTNDVESVAFSPDGLYALSGSGDYTLKLLEVATGAEIRTFTGHTSSVYSVAFSPDGRYALSGDGHNILKLWDIESGTSLHTLGYSHNIDDIAISPDGRYALSGSYDDTLKLWNVALGSEIRTFTGHTSNVYSVAFSPDGRYALSGSYDKTLKLWDIATGTEIRTFTGHTESVNSVAFSFDGRYALSGSWDSTLKLWDVATGAEIRTFTGHTHWVRSVAFSPDGRYALSGSLDDTLKLWDVAKGSEIRTFTGHTNDVNSVAFSPDGRYALSGSRDDTLKLWDVAKGSEIRTFTGHTERVRSVAFSPDGRYALSGSRDKTLKLWDVALGSEIRTFTGHTFSVTSVAFSPDGRYAFSGSSDRTLKMWNTGIHINQPPQAIFSLNPSSGSAPLTVNLDASASSDEGKISRYQWLVSDGQSAEGVNANLTFQTAGTYEITLNITDNEGATANTTQTITVTLPPFNLPAKLRLEAGQSQTLVPIAGTAVSWQSADTAIATIDNHGQLNAHSPGEVLITATDAYGQTASLTVQVIAAPTPPPVIEPTPPPETDESLGKAIIIAAGGAQPTNTLYDYTNDFTQRLYRLLTERGFSDDDIFYMNPQAPDIDLDGYLEEERVDYRFFDPEQELEDVFTQVAGKLWPGQQFIFFLHGHAREDHFLIRPDYELTASHLQNLLARLPTNVQQILILDSCYSGSFFNELTGVENRILISSADDHSLAWNTEIASFTDTFLRALRRGTSLHEAFWTAEELIKGDAKLFRNQQPWLDDDGDGLYTSLDGSRAAGITLAGKGIHAAPPPTITKVHPRQSLPENVTSATLWVRTTPSADGIRQVRAVLIKPDFIARDYQGLDTPYEQQTLELIYNAAQDRYELPYDGFSQSGRWEIVYQAQNTSGVWSDKVKGEIQATGTSSPAVVRMELNQSRYTVGEPLRLDMVVNGQARVDLYVALIFPDGNFQTIGYPLNLSFNNTIQVYQPNVEIGGQKTYPIMDLPLPQVPLGGYMGCGVLVSAGSDPHAQGNWIHQHCLGFQVY
jgi:WD40 repeat protein